MKNISPATVTTKATIGTKTSTPKTIQKMPTIEIKIKMPKINIQTHAPMAANQSKTISTPISSGDGFQNEKSDREKSGDSQMR